jgi:hypothetical protein
VSPDGLSWTTAFKSIVEGIDSAFEATLAGVECDVWVAKGVYHVYYSSSDDTIQLKQNVHVYGGFAGTESWREERDWIRNITVLDGRDSPEGSYHVKHVATGSNSATLDGFTITNGYAQGMPYSGVGGGMINIDCSPTISNCIFIKNNAYGDGWPIGPFALGGAMYNEDSSPILQNCTFIDNLAGSGGAIYNYRSSPRVSNSVFLRNSASSCASICNYSASMTLIINSTFVSNVTHSYISGIYNVEGSNTIIVNSILWNDSTPDLPEIFSEDDSSCNISFSNIRNAYLGPGNINEEPSFLDVEIGDLHLSADSPCIDNADGDFAPVLDMDGNGRFDDPETPNMGIGIPPFADMGAFEYFL